MENCDWEPQSFIEWTGNFYEGIIICMPKASALSKKCIVNFTYYRKEIKCYAIRLLEIIKDMMLSLYENSFCIVGPFRVGTNGLLVVLLPRGQWRRALMVSFLLARTFGVVEERVELSLISEAVILMWWHCNGLMQNHVLLSWKNDIDYSYVVGVRS